MSEVRRGGEHSEANCRDNEQIQGGMCGARFAERSEALDVICLRTASFQKQ
jgi:hypothetical protein